MATTYSDWYKIKFSEASIAWPLSFIPYIVTSNCYFVNTNEKWTGYITQVIGNATAAAIQLSSRNDAGNGGVGVEVYGIGTSA